STKHKILIIGSSGMLGVDLCQELKNDYEVIGADVIARPAKQLSSLRGREADEAISKKTLAVPSSILDPQFKEKVALAEINFSAEGVMRFIDEQLQQERDVAFKGKAGEWKEHRVEVIEDLANLKSIVFVRLAGLLASTRQSAYVDLTGETTVSKEYGGLPVVYIDSMLCNTPDRCVQRHEVDEILQWEYFRINVLGLGSKEEMGDWIRKHIDSPDEKLKGTDYEGLNSRQIAELFHGYSYPLRTLNSKIIGTTDFAYGYIADMLRMYPVSNTTRVNIAAKDKSAGIDYRGLFENNAKTFGGKIAWQLVLNGLKEKIGFATPDSAELAILDCWRYFIEANAELVSEGNKLAAEIKTNKEKKDDKAEARLQQIIRRLRFPKELESFIKESTKGIKGEVIARSSGTWEDNYEQNLAGVFISLRRGQPDLLMQAIKEIFRQAIGKIWVGQNTSDNPVIGLPNTIEAKEGIGILVQPFLNFTVSGTAMSNFYGHTAIEAVFGDASYAVKGIYANVTQFLFDKDDPAKFEYNPSFLDMPYNFGLEGKEYCVAKDLTEMRAIMERYQK
ncbi:MAG: hypothetical protein NT036_00225, partial [Candidatus Omnitrophica bacterium]|nr:hypothetical protein [Candidatus Omnitrophota bacterium]